MALDKDKKQEIITKYKLHTSDTGSPEVQIALISERLDGLSSHFQTHKKDHHSRRGLLKLVGQRRSLLKYLKGQEKTRYEKIIELLGLRK
ncbi:MAG TPA: 30S ribosomal protein S15 [Nitrospirae bacterium]|nr:30S ribosomal protein S15 [Nitrospirota bacterium]